MSAEGKRLGDGNTSPFGNGNGATQMGPTSGGNDFNKNPQGSGPKGGGNDFNKNPAGTASREGGRDFSKGEGKPQPQGEAPDLNTEGAPGERFKKLDGASPEAGGTGSMGNPHKPFKLGK